jgi:hypothetical protein
MSCTLRVRYGLRLHSEPKQIQYYQILYDCDVEHHLVVANVRERLVSKQAMQKFGAEKC